MKLIMCDVYFVLDDVDVTTIELSVSWLVVTLNQIDNVCFARRVLFIQTFKTRHTDDTAFATIHNTPHVNKVVRIRQFFMNALPDNYSEQLFSHI
jgi:hypothetical protein